MSVLKPSQAFSTVFGVSDATGLAVDADALPTGKLLLDGVEDAAVVTITDETAVGVYKAAVTIPAGATAGQVADIRINATVSTIAAMSILHIGIVDTLRISDLNDFDPAADAVANVTTTATATTVNGLGANVITAASIAADAGTEIAGATWDELAAGHTIVGSFGEGVSVTTNNDKTGYSLASTDVTLSATERDAVATALLDLANGVETSFTVRQTLRLISASVAGILSGAATSTITIKALDKTTTRLTATVDASGNRSGITYVS